jgi:hypothetical protein
MSSTTVGTTDGEVSFDFYGRRGLRLVAAPCGAQTFG